MNKDFLNVSEFFYSIQGEGQYQGYPAVFLRLKNCNLLCGQPEDDDLTKAAPGCKWICDTIGVWKKGKRMSFDELFEAMNAHETYTNDKQEAGSCIQRIKDGAHLIITGGEPLLQQEALYEFVRMIIKKIVTTPFIEVETNGTIEPDMLFESVVSRFNVSAKLSNSGNAKSARYFKPALQWHTDSPKSIFKFVTLDEEDTQEIINDFINEFNIKKDKIWLMPGAYNREDLWKNGQKVAELCKQNGWKMTSRMHVEIWDKLTGV